MANLVDFHLHTDVSDGSDTVEGLYHKILQSGVHTFSVTDHDMMEGTLEMEKLNQYEKWYADYEPHPQCPYEFSMWQYTEEGSVPGIDGNVDINVWFK